MFVPLRERFGQSSGWNAFKASPLLSLEYKQHYCLRTILRWVHFEYGLSSQQSSDQLLGYGEPATTLLQDRDTQQPHHPRRSQEESSSPSQASVRNPCVLVRCQQQNCEGRETPSSTSNTTKQRLRSAQFLPAETRFFSDLDIRKTDFRFLTEKTDTRPSGIIPGRIFHIRPAHKSASSRNDKKTEAIESVRPTCCSVWTPSYDTLSGAARVKL